MTDFDGIKGLAARRIELLRAAGITSRDDLATLFPIAYFDFKQERRADRARSEAIVLGKLVRDPSVRFVKRGLSITKLNCEDENGVPFTAVFYNRPYIRSQMHSGERYFFFGEVTTLKGNSMLNPLTEHAEEVVPQGFYTVYPTVKGIPRIVLKAAVLDCVEKTHFCSAIPSADRATLYLMETDSAYRAVHAPKNVSELQAAKRTVAIEEMTQLMLMFRLKKQNSDRTRSFDYCVSSDVVDRKIAELPFSLTKAQLGAVGDIMGDFASDRRMNRLIQGDVGSGKTAVAFLAMHYVASAGRQAALMAPTEILARQHYDNYCRLIGSCGVVCLTGGMNAKEKNAVRAKIASGEARIVIGTHTLFQSGAVYHALSLVVTDEQQRFGVAQRAAIEDKGEGADVLIMSATPIPRTMALLLYGDLDVSVLDEKPSGRKEIITRTVSPAKKEDMYRYLRDNALFDKRSYIVVPRVEEDDDPEVSAKSLYQELSNGIFRGIGTGCLYGALKEKEKNEVLHAFATGKTKILISTTVVEVGVDVREAANMVILGAERFGLSQLHQLRGRVGRGSGQSYCFLIADHEVTTVRERLKFLCECADGFRIADYDLQTRGAGDFIGMSQHGFAGGLQDMRAQTVECAKNLTEKILKDIPFDQLQLKEKYARLVQKVTLN